LAHAGKTECGLQGIRLTSTRLTLARLLGSPLPLSLSLAFALPPALRWAFLVITITLAARLTLRMVAPTFAVLILWSRFI
jgi:hypothetical protein